MSSISNVLNKGIYPQEVEDQLNGGTKLVKVQLEKGDTIELGGVELEYQDGYYEVTEKGEEVLQNDLSKADILPLGTKVRPCIYKSLHHKINIEKSKNTCWDGYVQYGTKKKNGKEVPNCIPKEEAEKKE